MNEFNPKNWNWALLIKTYSLLFLLVIGVNFLLIDGPLGGVLFLICLVLFFSLFQSMAESLYSVNNHNNSNENIASITRQEDKIINNVEWNDNKTQYTSTNNFSSSNVIGESYDRWCDRAGLEPESPGSEDSWREYVREQKDNDYSEFCNDDD